MARETSERRREAPAGTVLREGLVGGLVAGAVFAAAQMALAAAAGAPFTLPWQMAASILLGAPVVAQPFGLATFVVGFVVHFVLSALFGLIWGAVAQTVTPGIRDDFGAHAVAAMIYGLLLWLVNFQLIARLVYPWFLRLDLLPQLLLHPLAWGLPLGLYLAARLRPFERVAAAT